ncbi:Importin-beta N-terminal domain [Carpediemonas membranifera]|uniref:Importin-beta N-terminal domain n=1 Tax=Carpediemonas membranifera TaxID=201153 RepID=A0A8J6E1P8_9EUKA|nr:Importin-beta N-terminal domain [Carpediemonas membranifera]|eukprot:KAG9396639.1 Importin-beta N-terminal domain [Carpediemonas membranifera]
MDAESIAMLLVETNNQWKHEQAFSKLVELEEQSGFASALLEIFADTSRVPETRLIAGLCFKNFVRSQWKSRSRTSTITQAEIDVIRTALLTIPNQIEESLVYRAGIPEAIANAAHRDFPAHWEEYRGFITACPNPMLAAKTLRTVIKRLTQRRIATRRGSFNAIAPEVLAIIGNRYQAVLQQQQTPETLAVLEELIRTTQAMTDPVPSAMADALLPVVALVMSSVTAIAPVGEKDTVDAAWSVLRWANKLVCTLLRRFSAPAVTVIPRFIALSLHTLQFYAGVDYTVQETKERVACGWALKVLYTLLETGEYTTKPGDTLIKAAPLMEAHFSQAVAEELIAQCFNRFLILHDREEELWDADPDDIALEDGANDDFLRRCADLLVMGLCESDKFHDLVLKRAMTVLGTLGAPDMDVRLTDTALRAIGSCVYFLEGEVDFSSLLTRVHEVAMGRSALLTRRLASLIGSIAFTLQPEMLAQCATLLASMLKPPSEDQPGRVQVVSVTALHSLVLLMSGDTAWLQQVEGTVLETTLQYCVATIETCPDDVATYVLKAVILLTQEIGASVGSYLGPVMAALPNLWTSAQATPHLQTHIIDLCRVVIKVMAPVSEPAAVIASVLPLVSFSGDSGSDAFVNLADSAIGLLNAIFLNTRQPLQDMPSLVSLVFNAIDAALDDPPLIQACLVCLDHVAFLAPEMLTDPVIFDRLLATVGQVVNDGQPRIALAAISVLDSLARILLPHDQSHIHAMPEGTEVENQKILSRILKLMVDSAIMSSRPLVVSSCITLVCRVIFYCPAMVLEILQITNIPPDRLDALEALIGTKAGQPAPSATPVAIIVALSLEAFDTSMSRSKRMALALGILRLLQLARANPTFTPHVTPFWDAIQATLSDVVEENSQPPLQDAIGPSLCDSRRAFVESCEPGQRVSDLRSLIAGVVG